MVTGRLEQRSYESQDNEKRSVVEIVADEIGPSLRWATAQIDRNERRDGAPGGGGSSGGGQSGNQSGGSARSIPNDPGYGDEEPF